MKGVQIPTVEEIEEARGRLAGLALRTPLLRLNVDSAPAKIYLKLENLQPIGSFKLRGAGNAMRLAGRKKLSQGVCTASAGNMAQGVAWCARELGIPCTAIVPDHAPQTKLAAIERLGATHKKVSFNTWWNILLGHEPPPADGFFIHPVSDPAVIAGNGTVGLEIVGALPDVSEIIVPYGGGGLSCGIAAATKGRGPKVRITASEVETAAPLAASLRAGSPQTVEYTPSWVDGIGGKSILPQMWPAVSRLIAGSVVVSLRETAEALKLLLERNHVLAEGAGAASVAAALKRQHDGGKIVCVVSGGNIDTSTLLEILSD